MKKAYQQPRIKKVNSTAVALKLIRQAGKTQYACRQCSGCHGCR